MALVLSSARSATGRNSCSREIRRLPDYEFDTGTVRIWIHANEDRSPVSNDFRTTRIRARSTTRCPGQQNPGNGVTNVWIIGNARDVVIVDPAGAPKSVADAILGRQVTAVLCTHGHRAHIAAAMTLGEEFSAPVLLHTADHDAWQAVHNNRRYWRLDDGQRIAVGGEEIQVLHTPSATPGSVSLHIPSHRMVFTGDALSPTEPCRSSHASVLDTLGSLPLGTCLHPGHGDSYLLDELVNRDAHLDLNSA